MKSTLRLFLFVIASVLINFSMVSGSFTMSTNIAVVLETEDSGVKTDITIELIQEVVANYYKIKIDDMKSTTRMRAIAFPRQIAMYLSRKLTTLS